MTTMPGFKQNRRSPEHYLVTSLDEFKPLRQLLTLGWFLKIVEASPNVWNAFSTVFKK
jgi:hypothetical protein